MIFLWYINRVLRAKLQTKGYVFNNTSNGALGRKKHFQVTAADGTDKLKRSTINFCILL